MGGYGVNRAFSSWYVDASCSAMQAKLHGVKENYSSAWRSAKHAEVVLNMLINRYGKIPCEYIFDRKFEKGKYATDLNMQVT